MHVKRNAIIAVVLFVAAVAGAQDFPPSLGAAAPVLSTDSPVGPRDVLDVKVFQDPTVNGRVTVADDGRINLPILGKVEVAGLSPTQVELKLKGLLEAKYLAKADVSVQVVEYGNKPISVIGAVMRPGRIGVTGNITLIQAITQAGGLAPGYGRELYVLRTAANGLTEQIAIGIEDLMVNGNPDLNLPLAPNDVVNVPMDTPIRVYVLGEVMRPGTVEFRRSQTPTMLQALAGAGGMTDRAGKQVIVKRTVDGKETTMRVDYRKIVNGDRPDVQLLDNDTLIVRESVF